MVAELQGDIKIYNLLLYLCKLYIVLYYRNAHIFEIRNQQNISVIPIKVENFLNS